MSVLALHYSMKLDGILRDVDGVIMSKFSSQYILTSSMNPETGVTTD